MKFDVEIDGAITNIEVVKGVYPLLDAEAVQLVMKMPNWVPALGPNGNEKSTVRLPVTFSINDN